MDKFDKSIKTARTPVADHANFVDRVMDNISPAPSRSPWRWATLAGGSVVIAVIAVLILHASPAVKTSNPVAVTTPVTGTSSASVVAPGTDNASLASDLSGAGQSVNTSGNDLNSADSALNDSQPTISEN